MMTPAAAAAATAAAGAVAGSLYSKKVEMDHLLHPGSQELQAWRARPPRVVGLGREGGEAAAAAAAVAIVL